VSGKGPQKNPFGQVDKRCVRWSWLKIRVTNQYKGGRGDVSPDTRCTVAWERTYAYDKKGLVQGWLQKNLEASSSGEDRVMCNGKNAG